MITLIAGLSVCKVTRQLYGVKALIKWPNDIVIGRKKICGILTEMSTEIDYINYLVVGIGINVSTMEFPENIKEKATSIKCNTLVNRSEFIARIMKEFELNYSIFMKTYDLSSLQREYNEYLVSKDKEVVIIEKDQQYEGIALGINKEGELLVRTKDGRERNVFSGEVSVRGIYGYV